MNIENKIHQNDFLLVNKWTPDLEGPQWPNFFVPENVNPEERARDLIDESTGKKYGNEPKGTVRFKCFLLIFGTPFVHAVALLVNVACRIVKLVTFVHFWPNKDEKYDLSARKELAYNELLRVVSPMYTLIGLESSAIYGLFRPYDGRKLYATIERATYGNHILAPCFQPDFTKHLFGGSTDNPNAF